MSPYPIVFNILNYGHLRCTRRNQSTVLFDRKLFTNERKLSENLSFDNHKINVYIHIKSFRCIRTMKSYTYKYLI